MRLFIELRRGLNWLAERTGLSGVAQRNKALAQKALDERKPEILRALDSAMTEVNVAIFASGGAWDAIARREAKRAIGKLKLPDLAAGLLYAKIDSLRLPDVSVGPQSLVAAWFEELAQFVQGARL